MKAHHKRTIEAVSGSKSKMDAEHTAP